MHLQIGRGKVLRVLGVVGAITVTGVCADGTAVRAAAKSTTLAVVKSLGAPQYTIYSPVTPSANAAPAKPPPTTIPTWTGSFAFPAGSSFSYRMVGTDPTKGSVTTTIPTRYYPLKFIVQGQTFDAASVTSTFLASPLFVNSSAFTSGTSQYGDAMQRAEFWKNAVSTTSPKYHVLLGAPVIEPSTTYKVPKADGQVVSVSGVSVALVDVNWFQRALTKAATKMQIPGTVLPILLADNVVFYSGGNPNNCCILGFHGAYTANNTFAFASWVSSALYPGSGVGDITAMSHEISEWYNDPFTDNIVPGWHQPGTSGTACYSHLLEVGDELEALANPTFPVSLGGFTYHPQDEGDLSWFAHQSPSTQQNGQYSYAGRVTALSGTCVG